MEDDLKCDECGRIAQSGEDFFGCDVSGQIRCEDHREEICTKEHGEGCQTVIGTF